MSIRVMYLWPFVVNSFLITRLPPSVLTSGKAAHLSLHITLQEDGLSLTRILPYKDRTYDFVYITM